MIKNMLRNFLDYLSTKRQIINNIKSRGYRTVNVELKVNEYPFVKTFFVISVRLVVLNSKMSPPQLHKNIVDKSFKPAALIEDKRPFDFDSWSEFFIKGCCQSLAIPPGLVLEKDSNCEPKPTDHKWQRIDPSRKRTYQNRKR